MSGSVLEIKELVDADQLATGIAQMYKTWDDQRKVKREEWLELRNYLFATDTKTTSNSTLPWKNSTTTPKLTSLRDTLHANYMASLFSSPNWLLWEGSDESGDAVDKRKAITHYMRNKSKEGGFQKVVSQLLYDYIDYGNVFADAEYVNEVHTDPVTGEEIAGYVGPRAVRISPLDKVFNPTAKSFEDAPEITRYVKTVGELELEAAEKPELQYNLEIVQKAKNIRNRLAGYSTEDQDKALAYSVDGFGSISEYYSSQLVEVLEFRGDIHDESGNLLRNRLITVIDRSLIIRNVPNPSWFGKKSTVHAGWRPRPDNLWAMGPLDNLVGLQYRIDHLENLKADLFDLIAHPPIKIKGNVEEFQWGPLAEIYLGDDGEVDTMRVQADALNADQQIEVLMQRMELMAGAPREALGIRSPGEKTAFEVQSLDNASSRIFNERIRHFEIHVLEPLLNNMLEIARRNIKGSDLVRVMDDDLGVVDFLTITKEDITAAGKLYPSGSQHFATRAQMVQNMNGVFNSPIGQKIAPHISGKALARMVEDAFEWEKYGLVRDNVAIMEEAETQRLINTAAEDLEVEAMTPLEGEDEIVEETPLQ